MFKSLWLVSGLPSETEGQASLVDALSTRGVNFDVCQLSEAVLASREGAELSVVVLILPILGDNDLTDDVGARLVQFLSSVDCRRCAVVVVANGDRHVSDESVTSGMPFSIKVRHLLRNVGAFEMLETKLDRFTGAVLAGEVLDLVHATRFADVYEISRISRLLPRAPRWCARKRLLDFYDPSTGCSLLKKVDRKTQKRIASHIQAIAPRILKVSHAGLDDGALADVGEALDVEVVDVGSNDFSWEKLVPRLGACRWLSLAANGLARVRLSQLPRGIEHLYLQKNDLTELAVEPVGEMGLKSLSLYRNRLKAFDWPAEQSDLIRLNLGANPISTLPETLNDCGALEFLGLARTHISSLPEWVFTMPRLRELDISYIEDRIPSAQVARLRERCVSLITRPGLILS